jgi:rod shape-determining protein MreC
VPPVTETRIFLLRIALVWLVLELLAATQAVTPDGERVAWRWVRAVAQPIAIGVSGVGAATVDIADTARDTGRLLADNRRMQRSIEELQARNLLLHEDLRALREGSRLLATVSGLEAGATLGRCVFRDPTRGRMEVRVEGRFSVPQDTPVLGAGGLVGRAVEARGATVWIQLLTHPAAATAVQTANGSLQALATGSGRTDRLDIQYVPRTAELLQGEIFVTSGADGIYPAGIPVASVVSIRETEGAFLEVRAVPGVEFTRLRSVLLLPALVRGPRPGGWR